MTHLTDDQFNEYLDAAVDPAARLSIDSHLQTCESCRFRLDKLRAVFAQLTELSDAPLAADLRDSVVARLPRPPQRPWTPAFAAQCGIALGVFLWSSFQVARAVQTAVVISCLSEFSFPKISFSFPDLEIQQLIFASVITLPRWEDVFRPLLSIFHLPFSPAMLSIFRIPISGVGILLATLVVCLFWVLSNVALLHSEAGARK